MFTRCKNLESICSSNLNEPTSQSQESTHMFESGLLQTAEVPRSIHRLDYTTQLHMPIIKSTPTTHIHKPTTAIYCWWGAPLSYFCILSCCCNCASQCGLVLSLLDSNSASTMMYLLPHAAPHPHPSPAPTPQPPPVRTSVEWSGVCKRGNNKQMQQINW